MKTYYLKSWLLNLISLELMSAFLGAFGSLWLAVQIATFFAKGTGVPDGIRHAWPLFAMAGLGIAAYRRRPHLLVSQKLSGRDVTIEIAIGDIFSFSGAIIVGTNTTFTTRISHELISEHSVQGIFTRTYYRDETQLDEELCSQLGGVPCEKLQGKQACKTNKYPLGTCVRLDTKGRVGYFIAIAEINKHGVASCTFDGLKDSLAELWVYIQEHGAKGSLVMPAVGTGFGRLTQTREEVIREIIKSFVAACSERTFADKLTIVITPRDVAKYRISLDGLGSYLQHGCTYTPFASGDRAAIGTPI